MQWYEIRRRAAFLVVAQELRHAFPNWTESAYAEWIETYSSEHFEVGCLASFVAEARPVCDVRCMHARSVFCSSQDVGMIAVPRNCVVTL